MEKSKLLLVDDEPNLTSALVRSLDRSQFEIFTADSAQYPGKMAALGVSSIAKLARGGAKPQVTSGKDFFDTGTALVTKAAIPGLQTQTVDEANKACWG
jgi:fructose transport system substrate-binding protein